MRLVSECVVWCAYARDRRSAALPLRLRVRLMAPCGRKPANGSSRNDGISCRADGSPRRSASAAAARLASRPSDDEEAAIRSAGGCTARRLGTKRPTRRSAGELRGESPSLFPPSTSGEVGCERLGANGSLGSNGEVLGVVCVSACSTSSIAASDGLRDTTEAAGVSLGSVGGSDGGAEGAGGAGGADGAGGGAGADGASARLPIPKRNGVAPEPVKPEPAGRSVRAGVAAGGARRGVLAALGVGLVALGAGAGAAAGSASWASNSRLSGWSCMGSAGGVLSVCGGNPSSESVDSNFHSGSTGTTDGSSSAKRSASGPSLPWIRLVRTPPARVHAAYCAKSSRRTDTGSLAYARIHLVRASSSAERRACGSSSRQPATNSRNAAEYGPSGRRGGLFLGIMAITRC